MFVSAINLEGYNTEQRAFLLAHAREYSDANVFADLVADYAEELAALAW